MVAFLKKFIKAERTGNWMLHRAAVKEMLPYFAAAGHTLYAKSAYLYLQQMCQLDQTHPDVYTHFMNGFHVIRRSDRYWAGLSTDVVIEQVLMRSVKTSGGLTRGRGMTEIQQLTWILGMPSCAEVNFAMQELTGIQWRTVVRSRQSIGGAQHCSQTILCPSNALSTPNDGTPLPVSITTPGSNTKTHQSPDNNGTQKIPTS